jgi:hypothetical protein
MYASMSPSKMLAQDWCGRWQTYKKIQARAPPNDKGRVQSLPFGSIP